MNNKPLSPFAEAFVLLALVAATVWIVWVGNKLIEQEFHGPPNGAIRMTAPLEYHEWYEKTAQCAQLPNLDYSKIEWYVIPDVVTFPTDIGEKVALWEQLPDGYSRITVADFYVNNEMVVRHEMLHDLLNRFGRPTGHPALYFEDRCGLTWSTWKGPI